MIIGNILIKTISDEQIIYKDHIMRDQIIIEREEINHTDINIWNQDIIIWYNEPGLRFSNKNIEGSDPSRNASLEAWLWAHFGTRAATTLGLSIISIFALVFSWQSNDLLKK